MRECIAICALIIALSAGAVDKKTVDEFAAFGGVAARMEHLAKADNVFSATVDEVNREIADWKKAELRSTALKLLAERGFDTAASDRVIVIEWGGGGIGYGALYFAERAFVVREKERGLSIREVDVNGRIRKRFADLDEFLEKRKYAGNVSGGGCDIPTFVITVLGAGSKTVIVYDAVWRVKNMTDVERDTLAVVELIDKIHEACGIPPESGA